MAVLSHERVTADDTVQTAADLSFPVGCSHIEIQNGAGTFVATFDGVTNPAESLGFAFAANAEKTIPIEDAKNIRFRRTGAALAPFEVIYHGGRGI